MVKYTIDANSMGIWINGQYSCLARFGKYGMEIYESIDKPYSPFEQKRLAYSFGRMTVPKWEEFKLLVNIHHNIKLNIKAPDYVR